MRLPERLLTALALALVCGCSPGREGRIEEVLRRSRADPGRIVELESAYLKDKDPDVRALAVWAIGDSDAQGGTAALVPLAADSEVPVRLAVAKALCRIGGEETVGALTSLTSDADVPTRRVAVRCLSQVDAPPPGLMARALADGDDEVRKIALARLSKRPEAGTLPALLEAVERRRPEEQLAAVAALRLLNDPAALPGLEKVAAAHLAPAVRDAVEASILALRTTLAQTQKAEKDGAKTGGEPIGTAGGSPDASDEKK